MEVTPGVRVIYLNVLTRAAAVLLNWLICHDGISGTVLAGSLRRSITVRVVVGWFFVLSEAAGEIYQTRARAAGKRGRIREWMSERGPASSTRLRQTVRCKRDGDGSGSGGLGVDALYAICRSCSSMCCSCRVSNQSRPCCSASVSDKFSNPLQAPPQNQNMHSFTVRQGGVCVCGGVQGQGPTPRSGAEAA